MKQNRVVTRQLADAIAAEDAIVEASALTGRDVRAEVEQIARAGQRSFLEAAQAAREQALAGRAKQTKRGSHATT